MLPASGRRVDSVRQINVLPCSTAAIGKVSQGVKSVKDAVAAAQKEAHGKGQQARAAVPAATEKVNKDIKAVKDTASNNWNALKAQGNRMKKFMKKRPIADSFWYPGSQISNRLGVVEGSAGAFDPGEDFSTFGLPGVGFRGSIALGEIDFDVAY